MNIFQVSEHVSGVEENVNSTQPIYIDISNFIIIGKYSIFLSFISTR